MHLDKHLSGLILNYGLWTYLILFVVIFCETDLVRVWSGVRISPGAFLFL